MAFDIGKVIKFAICAFALLLLAALFTEAFWIGWAVCCASGRCA